MTPAADRVPFAEERRARLARAERRAPVRCGRMPPTTSTPPRAAWRELAAGGGAYQSLDFARRLGGGVPRPARRRRSRATRPARRWRCCRCMLRRFGPLTVAGFVGDAWANYHMGLFRPGVAWRARRRRGAAARGGRCGRRRPVRVRAPAGAMGRPRQSACACCRAAAARTRLSPALCRASHAEWLDAHFSRATQKKLRKKARKLEALGAVAHCPRGERRRGARVTSTRCLAHKAAQARRARRARRIRLRARCATCCAGSSTATRRRWRCTRCVAGERVGGDVRRAARRRPAFRARRLLRRRARNRGGVARANGC